MTYLSRYEGTQRVELPDGYWVDVKKCLSGNENRRARRNLISYKMVESEPDENGQTEVRAIIDGLDPTGMTREQALLSIVAWNIDGPDGVLPLEPEDQKIKNYGLLSAADQDTIEGVVNRLNRNDETPRAQRFPQEDEDVPDAVGTPLGQVTAADDHQVLSGA